jgi:hypothetical protein
MESKANDRTASSKGEDESMTKEQMTLGQLRREFEKVHSCATATDRWIAMAIMYDLERRYGRGYLTRKQESKIDSEISRLKPRGSKS